jgi:hypothetical protein
MNFVVDLWRFGKGISGWNLLFSLLLQWPKLSWGIYRIFGCIAFEAFEIKDGPKKEDVHCVGFVGFEAQGPDLIAICNNFTIHHTTEIQALIRGHPIKNKEASIIQFTTPCITKIHSVIKLIFHFYELWRIIKQKVKYHSKSLLLRHFSSKLLIKMYNIKHCLSCHSMGTKLINFSNDISFYVCRKCHLKSFIFNFLLHPIFRRLLRWKVFNFLRTSKENFLLLLLHKLLRDKAEEKGKNSKWNGF